MLYQCGSCGRDIGTFAGVCMGCEQPPTLCTCEVLPDYKQAERSRSREALKSQEYKTYRIYD